MVLCPCCDYFHDGVMAFSFEVWLLGRFHGGMVASRVTDYSEREAVWSYSEEKVLS